jgi:hypothetical protein
MPKGYPGTGKGAHSPKQPAEGGAVGGGTSEVRGPIKEMLAGGSEADFKDSLPEQTSSEMLDGSPESTKPRKKYTKKEKEPVNAAPVDLRLERAKAKASGLGAAKLIESGFTMAGEPLNDSEKEDVDDQFYLIATKAGIDPSGSWLFLVIYTIALLGRLILSRTELGAQVQQLVKDLFAKKEEQVPPPEPTK